jgi:hypothetical protein
MVLEIQNSGLENQHKTGEKARGIESMWFLRFDF